MPMPVKPRPRLNISAIDLLSVNLVRLRAERGWTQETLAYEAGLHRTYVGHVERKTRNPTLETVECLAAALEVSMAEMFKLLGDNEIASRSAPHMDETHADNVDKRQRHI